MYRKIIQGNSLEKLDELIGLEARCCVTSPPYWGMRQYNDLNGSIGQEETVEEYIDHMVDIGKGVRDCLSKDGTFWLNIGDNFFSKQNNNRNGATSTMAGEVRGGGEYKTQKRKPTSGLKVKDLCGVPWRVALALQADGWWLRGAVVLEKANPMPNTAKDRFTKSYEMLFLLTVSNKYYFDMDSIATEAKDGSGKKVGRKDVWRVSAERGRKWHPAKMPSAAVRDCILAGSEAGDIVLDPFHGSGTTMRVAEELGRSYVGIELDQDYIDKSLD